MVKKWILLCFIIFPFLFSSVYAWEKISIDAIETAYTYLNMNKDDEWWHNKHPKLWDQTFFFTDEDTPAYIEWTIICANNNPCGFIMVNIDGTDVPVPVASTTDISPSKTLLLRSHWEKEDIKFFYFGPFDIYARNIYTQTIYPFDPQFYSVDKTIIEERIQEIQNVFELQLSEIVRFKKSDAFQIYKNNLLMEKNNFFSIYSPWSEVIWNWKFVKWESSPNCGSRIPCYQQFNYNYGCAAGCTPVAIAMIFWYHDRVWNFPNLVPDTLALDKNTWGNNSTDNMIKNIRSYLNSYCSWAGSNTSSDNFWRGILYAKNQWLYGSSSAYTYVSPDPDSPPSSSLYTGEINAGRPVMMNLQRIIEGNKKSGHNVVLYWYHMNNSWHVRVNAGWENYWNVNVYLNMNIYLKYTYTRIHGFSYFYIQ